MSTYIMAEVHPKDGAIREVHRDLIGCPCYIVDIECGKRGLIKFKPQYEEHSYHRLLTSPVVKFSPCWDGEKKITIETENTVYIMKMLEEGK